MKITLIDTHTPEISPKNSTTPISQEILNESEFYPSSKPEWIQFPVPKWCALVV